MSIENQKAYLEEYATRSGFTNIVHLSDDGYSGTRWDRPAFMKMMEEVELGNVGAILIKDMSRLGRDHLRMGLILEQLREMGVRLIAIAEAIDTDKGEDDFMPFRNIIAEWHARDTSRKIRAIGKFELPKLEEEQEEPQKLTGTRGRKLRRDMTEEELQQARENDHKYYTRKVAAKRAAEEAARAAILQGTSYEIPPQESAERKTA